MIDDQRHHKKVIHKGKYYEALPTHPETKLKYVCV